MIRNLAFVFLFISTICASQEDSKPSYFGIKLGGNNSNISGDFSEEYNSRFSFHFGVTGEIMINNKLNLAPEILFSSIGAENVILNYISVPISFRYYPVSNFYLEAGPQAAYSLGAVKTVGSSSFYNDITNVNQTDFGFNLGFGFKTDTRFLIGLRYYFGLSNLIEDQEFVNYKNHNRVFQFSFAYLFKN
ncbi:porin family protein [Olleya sp. R77988]|uniref:porin family protein n=1 Tax=Olleya sp. R77988 TaxID=3093875 RepID=UPI0037C89935